MTLSPYHFLSSYPLVYSQLQSNISGWIATDNVDVAIQNRVTPRGHEVINFRVPTTIATPYLISYNLRDFAGNLGLPKYRLVFYSCRKDQLTCTDNNTDSLYCADSCGIDPTVSASTNDNLPPSIALVGPSVNRIPVGSQYMICPASGDPALPCDLGATATDPEDGDLTYRIQACPFSRKGGQSQAFLVGLTNCEISTSSPPGIYPILFYVEDTKGLSATVERTLYIVDQCDGGEKLCDDGFSCTRDGACMDGSVPIGSPSRSIMAASNSASDLMPKIELVNLPPGLNTSIQITQASGYHKTWRNHKGL